MGGYHPDFHRDGYPVVPRLGLRWSIGDNIVIKAGSYFALTSEALMAGGDFEASAHFGPAWAEVKFGAHGIVFFDPFHYDVSAYARIAAGVTIDTWIFGEITISVSLGARIHVLGPGVPRQRHLRGRPDRADLRVRRLATRRRSSRSAPTPSSPSTSRPPTAARRARMR